VVRRGGGGEEGHQVVGMAAVEVGVRAHVNSIDTRAAWSPCSNGPVENG
jgi:hypothetical protein